MGPHYTKARESCMHYTGEFADIATLSALEVLRLRTNGTPVLLVDVRLPEEQDVSMIEGAISLDEFESSHRRDQYGPAALANTTVVPYCTIGYRSGAYARKLKTLGYRHVRNGEGIVMWTHDIGSGLVDRDGRETKYVHTYGPPWDLVASDYHSVHFGVWNWIQSHSRGAWRWVTGVWRHVFPLERESTQCTS
ncbi:bile Acid:Na+ symporter family [Tribonema minus]|uniref:Bile Acid:Na+ symporter family n=1 Tax=Tribonema minus TaxID=303371 RepID=A0A836CAM6_9STRA|nr:bile Acid:Na+ symporter family [Tribonema minus]